MKGKLIYEYKEIKTELKLNPNLSWHYEIHFAFNTLVGDITHYFKFDAVIEEIEEIIDSEFESNKMKFYEPFSKVEDVKPYIGKRVIIKDIPPLPNFEVTIKDVRKTENKGLEILIQDKVQNTSWYPSLNLFYNAKFEGHVFGKEMDEEEEE